MSRAMKAALLSALVFPGSGHYFLKKYLTGTLLAGTAVGSLYVLVTHIVHRAEQIAETIRLNADRLDMAALTDLIAKQGAGGESQLLNLVSILLTLSWIIGIIDSYRVGRAQEKRNASNR